jgi:hypothetical protein
MDSLLRLRTVAVGNGAALFLAQTAVWVHVKLSLWWQPKLSNVFFLFKRSDPSINTDWRDKAAPAGYVKR